LVIIFKEIIKNGSY